MGDVREVTNFVGEDLRPILGDTRGDILLGEAEREEPILGESGLGDPTLDDDPSLGETAPGGLWYRDPMGDCLGDVRLLDESRLWLLNMRPLWSWGERHILSILGEGMTLLSSLFPAPRESPLWFSFAHARYFPLGPPPPLLLVSVLLTLTQLCLVKCRRPS